MRKPLSSRFLSGRTRVLLSGVALATLFMASGVETGHARAEATGEMAPVQTLQNGAPISFADIVDQVRPAVVNIQVKTRVQQISDDGTRSFEGLPEGHPFRRFFDERSGGRDHRRGGPRPRFGMSQGSGFIITPDGYVVTNNHVVEGGDQVRIVMHDGVAHDAVVVGTDPLTDLALLKIDAPDTEFETVSFASEKPRVGDWVLAMGNPFGLGGTATAGIVSASGRDINAGPYDDFIQIDAAVNRGNSGGPTFNLEGEVIGVNSMIFSPSGGNVGIAFAIPAELAERVVADLADDGQVQRGWLGVHIQPMTAELAEGFGVDRDAGAVVNDVQPGSPAETAGLAAGDIVTAVNGQPVTGPKDLVRAIGSLQPGATARIERVRDGEAATIEIRLGDLNNARRLHRS